MDMPTIIFLHSALGVSQDMHPLMEILQEKNYNCLSFDFSGHGKNSRAPEEFRIDTFARDLHNFLESHKLKDVTVFGHSMGGYVALYHQANYENSPVKTIVTYGTKFNWSEKSVARELPLLDPAHLQEKFPHIVESLKNKHGENWKHLLLSTAHMLQNLERIDGLTKEDMADIQTPVVFIIGDQDRVVTTEETHLAKSWLHHSLFKTLSHSKHELERSNLREMARIIEEAINGI